MIDKQSFHHIGYATNDMDKEYEHFSSLGYEIESDVFEDPIQGVRGCFIVGPGPRIELLENLGTSHTLAPWIDAGVKFYHLAYTVDNMDLAIDWFEKQRAIMTISPVPDVAFNNRNIAFFMMRNRQLIEIIER